MKKILVAVTAAVAAVLAAPTAHADSSSFLDALHDEGWYNSATGDVGLLRQGYAVCDALNYYNGQQVAALIYSSTDLSVGAEDAARFVLLAVTNLCPQHDHRASAVA